MPKWKHIAKDEIVVAINTNFCKSKALQKLGFNVNGRNLKKMDNIISKYKIDISHFVVKNSVKNILSKLNCETLSELGRKHGSVKSICEVLNINYAHYNIAIRNKLDKLRIKLDKSKVEGNWTYDEDQIVLKNYKDMETNLLCKLLPNRTWTAIKLRAVNVFNLHRNYNPNKKSNLSVLLEETPVSYYWIGFLLADGHFSGRKVTLTISIKDMEHIIKYSKFVQSNMMVHKNVCSVSCMDSILVPKIMSKFNITNRKTYEPCDISFINDSNLFLSLLVGFIDGDGCISKQNGNRTDCIVRIKCHSCWLDNLSLMSKRLSDYCHIKQPSAKINNQGYANINIANSKSLKFLKDKSLELNLPFLERKWNKINP